MILLDEMAKKMEEKRKLSNEQFIEEIKNGRKQVCEYCIQTLRENINMKEWPVIKDKNDEK